MKNRNRFKTKITNEDIAELPTKKFEGTIYVIDSPEAFHTYFPLIKDEKLLGFDTETKPSFKKGIKNKVALVQLASEKITLLFRLNKIGMHEDLIELLQDESITKVGVALNDDLNSLVKYGNYEPAGFIDLQKLVKEYGIEDNGLKKLTANILGFRISKRQQTSNWEQEVLTDKQIEYAATDAWVCQKIYRTLIERSVHAG
jgi:ribonuclease D